MNYDEFAFFNQQLAAMLHDGIPLEGALRRLGEDMRRGWLRSELQLLEADLAKGIPLREAVGARELPELYRHMIAVGIQSNDLPAVLTLLADHYQRRHTLSTRLWGLMVYPMIVLVAAFVLACFLCVLLHSVVWPNMELMAPRSLPPATSASIWLGPVLLGLLVLVACFATALPLARRFLRWRLPAFQEASVAQVASALALMLRSGVQLDAALKLAEELEPGTVAATELAQWRQRLASGQGKFAELASPGRAFPPLFVWLVARAGEDLAAGFQRAAEIYQARAAYRADLLLYSALPCSVVFLGLMILTQVQPVFATLATFMKSIGDMGEM
jgi:type IV pilus assembly protein PilC